MVKESAKRAEEPDWEEIRDQYQHSADSMAAIARRHGIPQAMIARRVHTHHWYRISDRGMAAAGMNDALIDMAMDVKRAVRSLLVRGQKLMRAALKENADLGRQTEAYRGHVETFGKLLQMIERLSVLLERASKHTGGEKTVGRRIADVEAELQRRLAKLAAARRANEDHPGAGTGAG